MKASRPSTLPHVATFYHIRPENFTRATPREASVAQFKISNSTRSVVSRRVLPFFWSILSRVIFSFIYFIQFAFICRMSLGKPTYCKLEIFSRDEFLSIVSIICDLLRSAIDLIGKPQIQHRVARRCFCNLSLTRVQTSRCQISIYPFSFAGVGSDLGASQGTGGGRSAQDTPEIGFSDRKGASQ